MSAWPDLRRLAAATLGWGLALAPGFLPGPARAADDGKIEIGAVDIRSLLDLSVEAVTRRAERASEAPAAVFVLTGEDVRRHGFRTLAEALAFVPGLFAYPGDFPQVGVRGMGVPGDFTTRLLVLIDGHPLANAMGHDLGRGLPLPLAAVERIEVIKGPVGSVYGPAAFEGVVNLVTAGGRPGADLRAAGEAAQGRLQGGELTGAWRGQGGALEGAAAADLWSSKGQSWTYPDVAGLGLPSSVRGVDGAGAQAGFARFRWSGLGAAAACGHSRAGVPLAAVTGGPADDRTALDGLTCFAEVTWEGKVAEPLTLRPRVAVDDFEQRALLAFPDPPAGIGLYHHGGHDRWVTAELRADWRPASSARLDAGATAQLHRVDRHTFSDAVPQLEVEQAKRFDTVNTWLLGELRVARELALHGGVTFFSHSVWGRQLTPKLAAVWQPGAADTVKAIWSTGFRPPTYVEGLYDDKLTFVANPDLRPERVSSAELAYEHRFGGLASVAASAFATRYRGLIAFITVVAPGLDHPPDPNNPGDFRKLAVNDTRDLDVLGAELALTVRLGEALQGWAGLSLQRPGEAGRPDFPRATANLALSTQALWRPLTLTARAAAVSARDKDPSRLVPGQRASVPALVTLAAGATLDVPGCPGLQLVLQLSNLLDARNSSPAPSDAAPVSEIPEAARTLRAELRWRL